jgi:hypothetical protein
MSGAGSEPFPVIIQVRRTTDILTAIAAGAITPLFVWAIPNYAWGLKPSNVGHGRGAMLFLLILHTVGWPGAVAIFAALAYYFGCLGAGAAWRLFNAGPALAADEAGVNFHPSLGPLNVPWDQVRSVRVESGRPTQIKVRLTRRFWSTSNVLWSDTVGLNYRAAGLSVHQLEDCAVRMRSLGHAHGMVGRRH